MEPDGKIDPIKLEEWINKARLDPNDPENEDLLKPTCPGNAVKPWLQYALHAQTALPSRRVHAAPQDTKVCGGVYARDMENVIK